MIIAIFLIVDMIVVLTLSINLPISSSKLPNKVESEQRQVEINNTGLSDKLLNKVSAFRGDEDYESIARIKVSVSIV